MPKRATTTALRIFPAMEIDQAAYRQEIANHLHDPFNKALVEVFWHGTDDYQRFIARDGLAIQQNILAQIRRDRAYYFEFGNTLKAIPVAKLENLGAIGFSNDLAKEFKKLHAMAPQFLKRADTLAKADERLTLALMHYMERNGDTPQPLQPVFNITNEIQVEPTPITMEASINVAPAEVAVNLPTRHTVTQIERNMAGEIISAEQIEKSI
jgi:hypothetical protein